MKRTFIAFGLLLALRGPGTLATVPESHLTFSGVPTVIVSANNQESCNTLCGSQQRYLVDLGYRILKVDSCSEKFVDIDGWGRGHRLGCKITFTN